jgi:hypothetical protein
MFLGRGTLESPGNSQRANPLRSLRILCVLRVEGTDARLLNKTSSSPYNQQLAGSHRKVELVLSATIVIPSAASHTANSTDSKQLPLKTHHSQLTHLLVLGRDHTHSALLIHDYPRKSAPRTHKPHIPKGNPPTTTRENPDHNLKASQSAPKVPEDPARSPPPRIAAPDIPA